MNIIVEKVEINVNEGGHYYAHVDQLFQAAMADQSTHPMQVNIATPDPQETDSQVIAQLMPIFMGDEVEVRRFYAAVKGAEPMVVVALVNTLLREQKLVRTAKNKILWTILHSQGIYTKSLNNWNKLID